MEEITCKRHPDGTRILYHFATYRQDCDPTHEFYCIDDSREANHPMEIILGKDFKIPQWEDVLRTLNPHEMAELVLREDQCRNYVLVSTAYRQYAGLAEAPPAHCCGSRMDQSTGCPKMDYYLKNPCDLRFVFSALKVEPPGTYEKEGWAMTTEERRQKIPILKEEGNQLFKQKKISEAASKYHEALSHLEALLTMEQPAGNEYKALEKIKWPILSNYAQCKLTLGDYYEVIRHCDSILEANPNDPKALYRRAKAHIEAWNPELAKKDLEVLLRVEPSMNKTVAESLKRIDLIQKQRDDKDKKLFQNMFA